VLTNSIAFKLCDDSSATVYFGKSDFLFWIKVGYLASVNHKDTVRTSVPCKEYHTSCRDTEHQGYKSISKRKFKRA
jgi:hypothetical protein